MIETKIIGLDQADAVLRRLPDLVESAADRAGPRAADTELVRVRARASSVGRRARLAVESVEASGSQIIGGTGSGPAAEIFFGAEFGGGGRPATRQFDPHRGTRGYFLFPQIRDDEARITGTFADEFEDVVSRIWDS